MKNKKISATVSFPVQIGYDTWKQHSVTKIFDVDSTTMKDLFDWMRSLGLTNPTVSDLHFSEIDDDQEKE